MTKGVYDEASDVKLFDKSHLRPSAASKDPEYAGNKHREQRHLLRHQVGIMNVLYCLTAFITIATVIFYVVNRRTEAPPKPNQVQLEANVEFEDFMPRLEAIKAKLRVYEKSAEDSLNDLAKIRMLTNDSFRFDEIAAKAREVESQKNTSLEAQQNNARLIIEAVSNISSKFRRIEERSRKIEILSNESIEAQSEFNAALENYKSGVSEVDAKISDFEEQLKRLVEGFRTFQAAYPSSCNHVDLDEVFLKSGLIVFCVSGYVLMQQNHGTGHLFDKDWELYKHGFQSANYMQSGFPESYWLGLETIHQLTRRKNCLLRIIFHSTGFFLNETLVIHYAQFSTFYIDGESNNYALHFWGHSGTLGNGLHTYNNARFTTRDRDNDQNPSHNCAQLKSGGWWYKNCGFTNLNTLFQERIWTSREPPSFLLNDLRVNTTMLLQCR